MFNTSISQIIDLVIWLQKCWKDSTISGLWTKYMDVCLKNIQLLQDDQVGSSASTCNGFLLCSRSFYHRRAQNFFIRTEFLPTSL